MLALLFPFLALGEGTVREAAATELPAESPTAAPEVMAAPEATPEPTATPEPVSPIPAEYEPAGESSSFRMYLRRDTLAIILESKSNGALLFSTVQNPDDFKDQAAWKGFYQSGIVMEYIEDVKSTPLQADFLNLKNEIDLEMLENGFTAKVFFPDPQIGYTVTVTLDEKGLLVKIPQESIINGEANGHRNTVSSFTVYPFLGYSVLGADEGYMIIPDGQGALISLQDNEGRYSSPFDRPVYGTNIGMEDSVNSKWTVNTEQVIMPIFGMVHTDKQIGFLGVIEQGDFAARIRAYPNGANNLSFDWVSAKYTYRAVYKQPTGPSSGAVDMLTESSREFDIVQRFLLEDGESASYAGLACAWRDWLEENGYFTNAEKGRPFDVEIDFLGAEQENYVLGKADVVMTSFDQAAEILDLLKGDGVNQITAVCRGWQNMGLSGGVPLTGFNPSGALGGSSGLNNLISKARGLNVDLALEADFLSLNPSTHVTLTYSAFKKITSQTWSRPTFGPVYDTLNYLTPEVSLSTAGNVLADMSRNNVPGVALTGITQLMSDYYWNSHYQSSDKLAAAYAEIASEAASRMRTTLKAPNAYLWRYAHALSDLPVTGSDYAYVSREVPMLAIALSGKMPAYLEYVNFQANENKFFLRLAEQGTRPCFLISMEDPIKLQHTNSSDIYSSRWDLYRVTVADWYRRLSELHALIEGASIIAHDTEGTMTRVTWSNGIRVYLNYGSLEGTMDGEVLEPMTWKVVK